MTESRRACCGGVERHLVARKVVNMAESLPPRRSWLVPSVLVAIGASALIAMFWKIPLLPGPKPVPPVAPERPKLSRDQSLALIRSRDRSIAALENGDFAEADRSLMEFIALVPEDPLGARNLTICRELALEKADAAATPAGLEAARQALEMLLAADPDAPETSLLAARVAIRAGDIEQAAVQLREATRRAPDSAAAWYDLFLLRPVTPGEAPPAETVDALRNTYELEPDNLFVLKDWLPLQAQLKDPQIEPTITRARQTLAPFAEIIKTNIRVDVLALLDRLSTAIQAQQWNVATSTAMTIRNVIVAEAARDERYVKRNSLEYMVFQLQDSTLRRLDLPPAADEAVPVEFQSQPRMLEAGTTAHAAADLDLDGQLESIVLAGKQLNISRPSVKDAAPMVVEIGDGFQELLVVDLDDDVDPRLKDRPRDTVPCAAADPDVIVFGHAGLRLFETIRTPELKLQERTAQEGLETLREIIDVIPGDLDLDGDLDFVTLSDAGLRLWSNRGNWSFAEITARSALPATGLVPTAAVAVDWDRDSDLDLIVAGRGSFGLLESLRHGRFRWRELGAEWERMREASALSVEQLPGRASWSLLGAGPGGLAVIRTETSSAGLVSALTAKTISAGSLVTLRTLDFDNDGVRDVVAQTAEGQLALWRGTLDGEFVEVTQGTLGNVPKRALAGVADLDGDGDEDLLLAGPDAGPAWALNDGGNANGWLNVALVALQIKPNEQNYSRRVNHAGIGSMVEVKAGGLYQAKMVTGDVTHFGLGRRKAADVARILWTNGIPQNAIEVSANQALCEIQKLHGSCPYLYTWDGTQFVFLTDLLWNAPLGLKFAETVIAPWREWENLKIDGDKLRPRDGAYPLRITAELWEVEYFDQVRLFAIDHPAGTAVYTNEKVGPPDLAEHRIHTVAEPRRPVAALDSHGRNILDQVIARDGIFTRTYDRKIAQGLTTEHYLELDLGSWPDPVTPTPEETETPESDSTADAPESDKATRPAVTLFLTGWMYPGSTSLSVQHSQNPEQSRQRPPSLQVLGSDGQWREARGFLGFPGGKTKTIAVDLSDVFSPGAREHRIRIVTNMEFYWDEAFVTVQDRPVEFRETEVSLRSARLVDRGGVSRRAWPATGNGPDEFFYADLVPGDAWPPIDGFFTRLGEVQDLLTAWDDQLVVMHPGDELQLEFEELDPPPSGWVRDFVIRSVGWDKDCDLNTVYGETSEPLPFRAMTQYGQIRERDPRYEKYLKTYQTRTRPRGPFWNRLAP